MLSNFGREVSLQRSDLARRLTPASDLRISPELDDIRRLQRHTADAESDIMHQRHDPQSMLVTSIGLVLLAYGLFGLVLQYSTQRPRGRHNWRTP